MKNQDYLKRIGAVLLLSAVLLTAAAGSRPAFAASPFTVNGVGLPLAEKGYRIGDYRGAGMCWEFARHIYYQIWNCFFYQGGGTEDDMLREYPSGEARRITAENARRFITAAPVGSVIRLQAVQEGPDTVKCNRHSLILLAKSEEGCTLYHDWSGYATVGTFTWQQFAEQFRYKIDFGYFKYIKYPGAKALRDDYTAVQTGKELMISSRIYHDAEILEMKR
ncbi:MAG: hypothetical protein IJ106_11940 [Parasporobacterium sp.]|nr:hypothetical protein [Parasporobacterium sp.]